MASVASQLIEEITAHAQSDSIEDAREICTDGTYFPKNPCIYFVHSVVCITSVCCVRYILFHKEVIMLWQSQLRKRGCLSTVFVSDSDCILSLY